MSYSSISIKEAMAKINTDWFLPAIQRPYVWGNRYEYEKYIYRLFDSLYNDYPIGVMIVWKTPQNIPFREFLKDLKDKNSYHNEDEGKQGNHTLVYDGQQRLQTLYSCLKYKVNDKLLVFDLNYDKDNDPDSKTGFRFVSVNEELRPYEIKMNYLFGRSKDDKKKDIRNQYKNRISNNDPDSSDIEDRIETNLDKLWDVFVNDDIKPLAYYEIPLRNEDKVNEIFERLNTGGVALSNADLLFSKIIGKGGDPNFQNSIMDFLDELESRYKVFMFDAYDILQLLHIIVRGRTRISAEIKPEEIKDFISTWKELKAPLEAFIGDYLDKKLHITHSRILRNKLPLFVIAIFFYKLYISGFKSRQLEQSSIKSIHKFFITAEINDWTLQSHIDRFRNILLGNKKPKIFPFEELKEIIREKGDREIEIKEKRFESYKWMALKFLMPDKIFNFSNNPKKRSNPELDHIFPVKLENQDEEYSEYVDIIWNMAPVTGEANNLKSNFHPRTFFKDEGKNKKGDIITGSEYMDMYAPIPDLDSNLWDDYKTFISWRKEQLKKILKEHYDIELIAIDD